MESLITIKNTSLQNLEIYLKSPSGPKVQYLQPSQVVQIKESQLTDQVRTLAARRMLKIS